MHKKKAAIYARFSSAQQRETSIDDQVRRCKGIAESLGFEVPDELTFADAAVSGSDDAVGKRAGYAALINAWDSGKFEAIVVDEVSRLSRGPVELAHLHERIEKTRVRLVTADGIDSGVPTWSLMFGVFGAVAQQARRDTRHRVSRGMYGQLQRGYMLADAAFGYRLRPEARPDGSIAGTTWEIEEESAAIVREMYERRRKGQSYAAIAAWLNGRGVAPPRAARDGGRGHWRQGSVHRLLHNPIYKGEFIWHGSLAKAQRGQQEVVTEVFLRPALRLVSDETWSICNAVKAHAIRGNRRHLLAGVVRCGSCGATLTVKPLKGQANALYCGNCLMNKQVGAVTKYLGSISQDAIVAVLRQTISEVFSPKCYEEFSARLKARLTGDTTADIADAERHVARAKAGCQRLAQMLRQAEGDDAILEGDDAILEGEYLEARSELKRQELRLAGLRERSLGANERKVIEQRLQVDPQKVCASILAEQGDTERARVVLMRLFPRVAFTARPARHTAVFEIDVAPGVPSALETQVPDDEGAASRLRITVYLAAQQPSRWEICSVQRIEL